MNKININIRKINQKYPIWIGENILKLLPNKIDKFCPLTKQVAIILDKNIPLLHINKIKKLLKK